MKPFFLHMHAITTISWCLALWTFGSAASMLEFNDFDKKMIASSPECIKSASRLIEAFYDEISTEKHPASDDFARKQLLWRSDFVPIKEALQSVQDFIKTKPPSDGLNFAANMIETLERSLKNFIDQNHTINLPLDFAQEQLASSLVVLQTTIKLLCNIILTHERRLEIMNDLDMRARDQ